MRKVHIKTFGCQMNTRDSEIVCGILQEAGYKICDCADDADVVIFNTCSVRKHAEDRVWSQVGLYKGKKIIGLIGCMAQNYKELAFERSGDISFVVGPQDLDKIPEVIGKILKSRGQSPKGGDSPLLARKIWETESLVRPEGIYHTGYFLDKKLASVVISEGCSNFCTYCVVPYVRGSLRHRKSKDIIDEIKQAVDSGIEEFTLLGQNVNAYQDGDIDFAGLLKQVNAIEGLKEFGFLTSHPRDTSKKLFELMRDLPKLKKHLHLPVQSGSDRVLKLMNRGYTIKYYLDLADAYRKMIKDGALSTDIIVGFPSESEEDFKSTCDLIKKARFEAAFIFKYSPRPNTLALELMGDLETRVIEERHKVILDLQRVISKKSKRKKWLKF